jgi:uncharacterized protein (TIGR02996 family)
MAKLPAEEAAFWNALERSPGDAATRQVFADWLEDRGDARAALMRDPVISPYLRRGEANPLGAMLRRLRRKATRPAAVAALSRLGAPAVPALLDLIARGNEDAEAAAEAINGMGSALVLAVPELINGLERGGSRGWYLRLKTVLSALVGMGAAAAPAVPRLVQFVGRTGSPETDGMVLDVLGAAGGAAEVAIPALISFLPHVDWHHPRLVGVLVGIGPPALSALVEAVKQRPPHLWWGLAVVLRAFGDAPVSPLRGLLTSEVARHRIAASVVLCHWDADVAQPQLLEGLRDPSPEVRRGVVASIARLERVIFHQVRHLLKLALSDEDESVRSVAAQTLRNKW